MAKSTIKNESPEFDLDKIRRFTEQELTRLEHSELPWCYQIGKDILVGSNRVEKINDRCWRVWENHQPGFDFLSRRDAIYYCIALHKKNNKLAEEIKNNDVLLNNLEFEASLYRRRYKKANQQKDSWASEYYSNKYIETMHKINRTKRELRKSLNLAKYIKL